MAAAVEGTPRRVRALLSSFLHTSDKEEETRYAYKEKITSTPLVEMDRLRRKPRFNALDTKLFQACMQHAKT